MLFMYGFILGAFSLGCIIRFVRRLPPPVGIVRFTVVYEDGRSEPANLFAGDNLILKPQFQAGGAFAEQVIESKAPR